MKKILIIPDVRSAHNVGSLFRTADAAGIDQVFICGYSPCPIDKYGRAQGDIAKTALGAEKSIPWSYHKSGAALLKKLKKEGVFLIAVEQGKLVVDYKKVKLPKGAAVAFVAGNEVGGISVALLKVCDVIAEIPMRGEKESLNVSVALGIAMFRILKI